jgi:galactofuranosylgalactofuranosylrhamnosyl-N-acetylglucosaminyl-diphospho-decaprenol beta-1,5/1,6-galactofuranosyltransferase
VTVIEARPVQRVVFPVDDVDEVFALYIEDGGEPTGRTTCRIAAGQTLRLCTYFNSFPAAYWRRWTPATAVQLEVALDGEAEISIWRSQSDGTSREVETCHGSALAVELPIDSGFDDGGLYWFCVQAPAKTDVNLISATWSVAGGPTNPGTVSLGITTFNRPTYCLDQLRRIAAEPALLEILDQVYVVDQGSEVVSDQPGFAALAAHLGTKLSLIRQGNLGGSGGFSRAMAETLEAASSQHLVLLDDDAIGEPESIIRAVRFADVAATQRPVLVGGAMFHLDQRTVLYTQGETIDFSNGLARPLPGLAYDIDFAEVPLRTNPALHQRHDALFNGWWMTLIPTEVLREQGLGLPYFIKWDDLEFALRCSRADIATVSLPGVAVWHQAWHNKFSWRNWETYFTERNMWLTLLAHQDKPRRIPLRAFVADFGMIVSLQYSSAALRIAGRRDAERGLSVLHSELATRLPEVQQLRARFVDTAKRAQATDFPTATNTVTGPSADPRNREPEIHSAADALLAVRVAVKHLLVPPKRSASAAPQLELSGHEAIWRQFLHADSAVVRYPDGYVWVRRDWGLTWRLLWQSGISTLRLQFTWPTLRSLVRTQSSTTTDPRTWWETFTHSKPT